eukprot:6184522-Pleurochrysis_carterae.AAC.1
MSAAEEPREEGVAIRASSFYVKVCSRRTVKVRCCGMCKQPREYSFAHTYTALAHWPSLRSPRSCPTFDLAMPFALGTSRGSLAVGK